MTSNSEHPNPVEDSHGKHFTSSNAPRFLRLALDRPRLARNREVQACEQCRSRKIRCDQSKPHCLRCRTNNRPCIYRSRAAKRTRQREDIEDHTPAIKHSQEPRSPPRLPHGEKEEGQIIQLNQLGYLKATSGVRLRYYSSSSWVAGVEDSDVSPSQDDSHIDCPLDSLDWETLSPELLAGNIDNFIQLAEVDRLIAWYSNYCHFWYPLVDITEVKTSLQDLRNYKGSSHGSSALITAICYTAACSASASRDIKSQSSIPISVWKNLANQLLSASGYPSRPNLNTIRSAFLLATPSVAEGNSHPDPSPICVLLRAAQSLGLHREPLSFQLSTHDAEFSRILWWSIRGLDATYAMTHALPPLIHPTTTDVRMVDCLDRFERKLLSVIIQTALLISKIFHGIYGVRQPTFNDIQNLSEEAEKICTEEISDSQNPNTTALERFIAMSRMMCCCRMLFILHQPYLRTSQWPRSSREKALNACRRYINAFLTGVTDPSLSPYRWVLEHFDVIHACAILLQDLIQHPGSPESSTLRNTAETCFSTFSGDSHPGWTRLETLRSKAWSANRWHVDEQIDPDLLETDISLADWDPLFASFIWEELLI